MCVTPKFYVGQHVVSRRLKLPYVVIGILIDDNKFFSYRVQRLVDGQRWGQLRTIEEYKLLERAP